MGSLPKNMGGVPKTVQFTDNFYIKPGVLRESVENPREYADVCAEEGSEYYEYGQFPLVPTLKPEDYKFKEFVGRGTFARCFKSQCLTDPNRFICIKVLKRAKETHYVKLRRELSILTKLQGCPGVVNYYGLVKDPSCLMWSDIPAEFEKAEQVDLQTVQQSNNYNPENKSRDRVALCFDLVVDTPWKNALIQPRVTNDLLSYLLFQVAVCLDKAHSFGIMHRDIKPPNCLLDLENERVVVVDWGQAEFYVPYFKHNVQVGGRSFKAPELVFGGNIVRGLHDYSVDVWAFGVMMASMVLFGCTKNLFYAMDREGVIDSIASLLGTKDLIAYLRERPHLELSDVTIDLCSHGQDGQPEERDSPIQESVLVQDVLLGDKDIHERDLKQWKERWTPEALELIDQILRYNPRERPTFREMMVKSPYFEHARQKMKDEHNIILDPSLDPYGEENETATQRVREIFISERVPLGKTEL